MQTLTTTQSIDIAQLSRDLFSQIISVNATYLTISVSIILGSGILITILMYFLNFKPMKQSLDKQTENIENIKKETELKVEDLRKSQSEVSNSIQNLKTENDNILKNLKSVSDEEVKSIKSLFEKNQQVFNERMKSEIELGMKEVDSKISTFEQNAIKKITAIERANQILDLQTTWDMHYVWEDQKVPANAFRSIVATLEKTINFVKKYDDGYAFYFGLSLGKLPTIIDSLIASNPSLFLGIPETIDKLKSCLSFIPGLELEKKEVVNKIEELGKILGKKGV